MCFFFYNIKADLINYIQAYTYKIPNSESKFSHLIFNNLFYFINFIFPLILSIYFYFIIILKYTFQIIQLIEV